MLTLFFLLMVQVLVLAGISHWIISRGLGRTEQPLEFNILIGLCLVGLIGHTYSIIAPLDWRFQLAIFLAGATALADRSYRDQLYRYWQRLTHQSLWVKLLLIIIVVLACFLASGPIIRDDSESYHLQNILWIRSYGTVPGLANLHSRFGFNSIWFHGITTLVPAGQINYYTTPNTLLSLTLAFYLLIPNTGSKSNAQAQSVLPALLTLFIQMSIWYYWRGNVQSTNYDYIFTAFSIVFYIHFSSHDRPEQAWRDWAIWVPPILFCIRPLYAPSMIFTLIGLLSYWKENKYSKTFLFVSVILGILTLFIYRNYLLSGYPLFPSSVFNVGDAAWKMPTDQLKELYGYIRNYTIPREKNYLTSLNNWITGLYNYDRIFMLLGVVGICWHATSTLKRKDTYNRIWQFYIIIQLAAWFIISPEPRFIAGIFGIGHFLLFKNISSVLNPKITKWGIKIAMGTMILSLCALIGNKIKNESDQYANLLIPISIPTPESHTFTWEGVSVQIPERWNGNWNPRCFLITQPCVYDSLPGIKMLGDKIEKGFYVEKEYKRKIP